MNNLNVLVGETPHVSPVTETTFTAGGCILTMLKRNYFSVKNASLLIFPDSVEKMEKLWVHLLENSCCIMVG